MDKDRLGKLRHKQGCVRHGSQRIPVSSIRIPVIMVMLDNGKVSFTVGFSTRFYVDLQNPISNRVRVDIEGPGVVEILSFDKRIPHYF